MVIDTSITLIHYMTSSISTTEAIDHLFRIADDSQGQSLLTQPAV